ncbi:MAG: Zn-finger containing protein [Clostridia bacterium]|jgi:predicted membrane protein|nr:Zn-finger containing protein [Clostridia bacterium]
MNGFKKFMYGRYGLDQLSIMLLAASILFSLLALVFHSTILQLLTYILLGLAYLRGLSKNISKRQQENRSFLRLWLPIKIKLNQSFTRLKYIRTHKYYKCPECAQTLRVPKGRGRIRITCPQCKNEFSKKS